MFSYSTSVRNSKIVQVCLKSILGGEAGVHKEAFFVVPLFESAIVKQLQVILDDERHNVVLQTLFKEDQSAYTAVSVLEGMDALKGYMESYDVLKSLGRQCIIVGHTDR